MMNKYFILSINLSILSFNLNFNTFLLLFPKFAVTYLTSFSVKCLTSKNEIFLFLVLFSILLIKSSTSAS